MTEPPAFDDAPHPATVPSEPDQSAYQIGPAPTSTGRRWWRRTAFLVTIGIAIAAVGVAAPADAYVRHDLCSSIKAAVSADSSQDSAGADPSDSELRKQISRMRTKARLLVLHPSLRSAILGLAGDLDRMLSLTQGSTDTSQAEWGKLGPLLAVVGSADGHVRDAQRACGQPETGIMGGDNGSNGSAQNGAKPTAPAGQEATPEPTQSTDDTPAPVKFGQSFTWRNNLQVTVSRPTRFQPSTYAMAPKAAAYLAFTLTIVNNSGQNYDPSLFNVSAQSGSAEAEQVFDTAIARWGTGSRGQLTAWFRCSGDWPVAVLRAIPIRCSAVERSPAPR